MNLYTAALFIGSLASATAFAPSTFTHRSVSSLNIVVGDDMDVAEKVKAVFANSPKPDADFDEIVQLNFPGALSNKDLVSRVVDTLALKGYSGSNTLLATSFCCDELARQLEDDFNGIYGNNFNLGGLAGFPFAGNTGFGAMAAHIPDNGYCVIAYGPHVGITADGTVGKVERSGIELVDNCCGSAIAASNYVKGITDGGAQITTKLQEFTDFQQGAVQELILPHGRRLSDAEDRMAELPFALYESQDMLMSEIVKTGSTGIKRGLALLGGVQINTGPDTLDYFVPLRFDFMNYRGEVIEDMLPSLKDNFSSKVPELFGMKLDDVDANIDSINAEKEADTPHYANKANNVDNEADFVVPIKAQEEEEINIFDESVGEVEADTTTASANVDRINLETPLVEDEPTVAGGELNTTGVNAVKDEEKSLIVPTSAMEEQEASKKGMTAFMSGLFTKKDLPSS